MRNFRWECAPFPQPEKESLSVRILNCQKIFISVIVSVDSSEFNISIELVFITKRFFCDQCVPVVAENGADKFDSL